MIQPILWQMIVLKHLINGIVHCGKLTHPEDRVKDKLSIEYALLVSWKFSFQERLVDIYTLFLCGNKKCCTMKYRVTDLILILRMAVS